MASYNPYYPNGGYQQYPYQQYQYPQQQYQVSTQAMQPQSMNQQPVQQMQPQVQQVQPQIQNGGFISVRSRDEAFNYPVAPGTSVTFKDENAPYVYTKTKGFSQLEQPVFESYKLVREDLQQAEPVRGESQEKNEEYALKSDLEELFNDLDNLRQEIDLLKKSAKKQAKAIKPVEIKEESEKVEVEA